MSGPKLFCVCGILAGLSLPAASVCANDDSASAMQLFEQRIMPIFRSPKPSSCVQCHLSSVDIKDYILPSSTDTFVALREQGLVDLDSPEKSKILTLIRMGDQDPDAAAQRIHQKTRQAEFEAFSGWIKACCKDPALREATLPTAKRIGPDKPPEVVRHARKSRVVDSFARNIWSQRMRCFPCHTPHELDAGNPKHEVLIQRHDDLVKKFGRKMDLFRETPEATLDQLIASSRRKIPGRYPLINLDDPAKSLLILKPTSKLPPKDDTGEPAKPSSMDPVSHMGGLKMHVNDHSYKSFMNWLQDYANTVQGTYTTVRDLPADNWVPTDRVLRMKDAPEAWGQFTAVQMFVHQRSQDDTEWSDTPVAFTQGLVTPRAMVNGPLSLLSPDGDSVANHTEDFPLAPGQYLIRVFVDTRQRLHANPTLLLGDEEFVGQAEITTQWQRGFPKADMFSAESLQHNRSL